MEFYWWSEDIAQAVLSMGLVALPTLMLLVSTLRGAEWLVNAASDVWRAVRTFVDEPSDALVQLIAERTGKTPEWVIKHGTEKIDIVLLKTDDA